LDDSPATTAAIFHDTPVAVFFDVLTPPVASQKHDGHPLKPKFFSREEAKSTLQALLNAQA